MNLAENARPRTGWRTLRHRGFALFMAMRIVPEENLSSAIALSSSLAASRGKLPMGSSPLRRLRSHVRRAHRPVNGAADMISVYIRETLIQLRTPDWVRGRVTTVNMVFIGVSNELGAFRAGMVVTVIGVVPAVVFGGVGMTAIAGLWTQCFPEFRRIRLLGARLVDWP
jgi:hypothetical protein